MRTRTIIPSLFLLALACSSAVWSQPAPLPAPRPPIPPPPTPISSPPNPELSTIIIPIHASLAPLLPQIESRVASTFNDTAHERGIDIRYEVRRDPLQLRMVGAGLHASTTVHYALEACRGSFPCISCGFDEGRREADITLHTKLQWDPSWRLRSTTTLLPVDYAKPCQVTWLNIDITKRFVAPVVEQQLNAAAKIIDKNTPALATIRPYAEQVWTSLQTPVELAPRTWLVLEPSEVGLAPLTGSGLIVTTTLGLRAYTRIVVGDKPAVARRPLPALKYLPSTAQSGGVRVPFDLQLPYDDATQYISAEVAGKTFPIDGKPLTINTIRLAPAANGKVLIEASIDYRGGRLRNYKGLIFLEGTPRFDPATSMIVIPDLDYSLDPKRRGFLSRIAERVAHDTVRTRLRSSARFPLAPRLNAMREEITRALTRTLAPGVQLRGRADALQAVSVTPQAGVLLIRMLAVGRAEVAVIP